MVLNLSLRKLISKQPLAGDLARARTSPLFQHLLRQVGRGVPGLRNLCSIPWGGTVCARSTDSVRHHCAYTVSIWFSCKQGFLQERSGIATSGEGGLITYTHVYMFVSYKLESVSTGTGIIKHTIFPTQYYWMVVQQHQVYPIYVICYKGPEV